MKRTFFKIVFSLIVFTYVFSSVGVCLVAHYCGGELEKISLFSKPSSCCDGEDQETDSDCCSNDSRHVAFQKDFTFYTLISDSKAPVQQLFIIPNNLFCLMPENACVKVFRGEFYDRPPNLVQDDIVHYSVLRI